MHIHDRTIATRLIEALEAVKRAEDQGRKARVELMAVAQGGMRGRPETERVAELDKAAGLVMVRSLNVVRAHTALLEVLNGNDPVISNAVEALKDTH